MYVEQHINMITNNLIKNFEKNVDEIYEKMKEDCSTYGELYDGISTISEILIFSDKELGMAIRRRLKEKIISDERGLPIL